MRDGHKGALTYVRLFLDYAIFMMEETEANMGFFVFEPDELRRERIGNNVRAVRKSMGLSQESLAEKAGIGVRTLTDIETCRTASPGVIMISHIAMVLNCRIDDLVFGDLTETFPERSFFMSERNVCPGELFDFHSMLLSWSYDHTKKEIWAMVDPLRDSLDRIQALISDLQKLGERDF